MQPKFVAA
ncbi:hypothetical protein ECEC4437_3486, partial [Escherichia coli EC4437]